MARTLRYARLAYSQQTRREGHQVRALSRKKVAVAPARVFAAVSVIATVGFGYLVASGEAQSPIERPLSKNEVADLFEGKSWLWSDGSGYFAPKGRFLALAGSGSNRGTLSGDWVISQDGKLCFSGVWKAKSGSRFERTCFLHKTKDGHIYQQRLPNGEWYVFKHDPEKEGDQKLVAGDQKKESEIGNLDSRNSLRDRELQLDEAG